MRRGSPAMIGAEVWGAELLYCKEEMDGWCTPISGGIQAQSGGTPTRCLFSSPLRLSTHRDSSANDLRRLSRSTADSNARAPQSGSNSRIRVGTYDSVPPDQRKPIMVNPVASGKMAQQQGVQPYVYPVIYTLDLALTDRKTLRCRTQSSRSWTAMS